jgi:hypothetical protein
MDDGIECQLKVGSEKLYEDKQTLRIVKQQLENKTNELQREREQFYAKHASVDMDKYFAE